MSDSEDSSSAPSDAQLTSTLKRTVARFFAEDSDNLTLKRVRAAIENELNLPANWLKNHNVWAAKSKELITSEVARLEEATETRDVEGSAVDETKEKGTANKNAAGTNSKKRKPIEEPKGSSKSRSKPRKKRKVSNGEDEDEAEKAESSASNNDTPSPANKRRTKKARTEGNARSKKVVDSDDEDEGMEGDMQASGTPAQQEPQKSEAGSEAKEDEEPEPKGVTAPPAQIDGNESESSLSSLLDEPPAKKRRQRKSPAAKAEKSKVKAKGRTSSKAKPAGKELTPDEEEIKRLQGWLLKCGIRKVWGKELKPFETPKAKIAHLKSMLADAGMTGRYSIEKASRIKEQRELAADLEAVTAFDERWGNKEEKRPRGRGDMAKSLGLDPSLLEDSDGDGEDD
ncbi:uncharacterized protein PV09_05757 [Verruconis gallopava]|uniref:Transcriptional regulator n=1 Tax=Verruconis gallopava TaxID=253628 RepID=A0A0D2AVF2_9PEZI|nr:uncharacterized protein PV09_05757 [Verruconis gallopava]KIW03114.1 hypothetical protein PV09_05757 [Verruconis gallopava]